MNLKTKLLILAIAFPLVFIPVGAYTIYANPSVIEYEGLKMRPTMDIADNLSYSPETNQFGSMIEFLKLEDTLHKEGPFTVFAPTNTAYNNLSHEYIEILKQPANEAARRKLALYHIVKGKYLAENITNGMELTTLQGEKLKFTRTKDYWIINGYSYIETYDIESKNGVIHTITSFVVPPSELE